MLFCCGTPCHKSMSFCPPSVQELSPVFWQLLFFAGETRNPTPTWLCDFRILFLCPIVAHTRLHLDQSIPAVLPKSPQGPSMLDCVYLGTRCLQAWYIRLLDVQQFQRSYDIFCSCHLLPISLLPSMPLSPPSAPSLS